MARTNFRGFVVSLAVLCALTGCKDESVTETCEKIEKCGGVVDFGTCESNLKDMVRDGRISQERASACAVCMARNSCGEITSGRHCDTACDGVGYVENLFTSADERRTLCDTVVSACNGATKLETTATCNSDSTGGTTSVADCKPCPTALRDSLVKSPGLDEQLNQCALCVDLTNTEGSGGENGIDAGEEEPLCTRLTTRCRDACANVGIIAETFAKDEAARAAEATAIEASLARQVLATNLCNNRYTCDDNASEQIAICSVNLIKSLSADASGELVAHANLCALCLAEPCETTTRLDDCGESCSGLDL